MDPHTSLVEAVQRYFDILCDNDVSKFDDVFLPTARLHGFGPRGMVMRPAQSFRDDYPGRPSPKSMGSPRQSEILRMTSLRLRRRWSR